MSPSCHQQYIESRQSTYPQLPKLQTRPSFQQNLFERCSEGRGDGAGEEQISRCRNAGWQGSIYHLI